jgi:ABC-type oligopeptide transport system substrate-binding subunit
MRRSKVIAIAILLSGTVAFGLTACGDRNKEQTKGTTGPSDAARGPANPANPQGPSGPGQGPGDPAQSPSGPTEPGKSR